MHSALPVMTRTMLSMLPMKLGSSSRNPERLVVRSDFSLIRTCVWSGMGRWTPSSGSVDVLSPKEDKSLTPSSWLGNSKTLLLTEKENFPLRDGQVVKTLRHQRVPFSLIPFKQGSMNSVMRCLNSSETFAMKVSDSSQTPNDSFRSVMTFFR